MNHEFFDRPIPWQVPSTDGWKAMPIKYNQEPLVALGPFSDYNQIFTNSIYAGECNDSPYVDQPIEGSLITEFVRKDVASQLVRAQKLLPSGLHLVAYDIYRPLQVQQSLYDFFYNNLRKKNPDWTKGKLTKETQNYVSLPSYDPDRPSPHNTGGVVDLAIFQIPDTASLEIEEITQEEAKLGKMQWERAYEIEMRRSFLFRTSGKQLEFGTAYDYGGDEAAISYFENLGQDKQLNDWEETSRNNRRLLYHIMRQVGFEAYEHEWWHFNSRKTQMGAKAAGLKQAEYGMATLSDQNKEHEDMRIHHRRGTINLALKQGDHLKAYVESRTLTLTREMATITGDPRISSLASAVVIQPV